MSISVYEGQVRRYRAEIQKLQAKRAKAEAKAADAERTALRLEQDASKASPSAARLKSQRAARKRKEAATAREAAANASKAISRAQKRLNEVEGKLAAARAAEATKQRREAERAERRQIRNEQRRDAQLAALESDHAALASHVASEPWANAPDEVTVMLVAASPDGETPLRIDREVREIQQRLRMSEHRDSVKIVPRLAARSAELLQYLNEDRPHILHFSGHSDRHGLAFEDADGYTKLLDNDQLGKILHAAPDRIRLALFNSCQSSGHAELATTHVDAAIGMEHSIGDDAAKIFAAQFYNALGFGCSLQKAFDQACTQLQIETGGRSGDPQLYVAPGLDANEIYLVAPPMRKDARETRM